MVPGATRSKMWVCGHALPGIAGPNPAGGMDVCFLLVLCGRADHSSRGVLPSVVCPVSVKGHDSESGGSATHKKKKLVHKTTDQFVAVGKTSGYQEEKSG
jgi:hypothetical protein